MEVAIAKAKLDDIILISLLIDDAASKKLCCDGRMRRLITLSVGFGGAKSCLTGPVCLGFSG